MHVHEYESRFVTLSIGVLLLFAFAVALSVFGLGVTLPGNVDQVNPEVVRMGLDPVFANPGLREIYPGEYEVVMVAQSFTFTPSEITVPVNAHVTFLITSTDVIHGFKAFDTNINIMVIPGQVSRIDHIFTEPGVYPFYCHEYCGSGHHTMTGHVNVVEPVTAEAEGN